MSKTTYKSSGVNIDAGNHFVKLIKPLVDSTRNKYSNTGLGGFSGAFSLPGGYKKPLLISATDGVGTKLKLAIDSDVLWYGSSYGTIDIERYNSNPPLGGRELPDHISEIEAGDDPYQRINVYLVEIPELGLVLVPIMAVLILFVVFRRRKRS